MHPRLRQLHVDLARIATSIRLGESDRKHMVILLGGPASGKGFFTENLKDHAAKILADSDAPSVDLDKDVDEGDGHLRNLQWEHSVQNFNDLSAAHKKGKAEFEKALDDHWYRTKDGSKKKLSDILTYDNMPATHDEYYGNKKKKIKPAVAAVGDFYVSMRGWHDDTAKTHTDGPLKGKPIERFKDLAREHFDRSAKRRASEASSNLHVLDSAGEDIDVQDFEGQIKHAQANGYEVTVVHLDMDPEDMTLSNLIRGAKGDRMVDQADIDNFAKTAPKSIEHLRKASPDRFVHYKRTGSALSPEERTELKTKIKEMNDARLKGASKEDLAGMEKAINKVLRRPQYEIQDATTDLGDKKKPSTPPAKEEAPAKQEDTTPKKTEAPKPQGGYGEYVDRKRQEGGRPMPKREWEARYATTSERIREVSMRISASKSPFDAARDALVDALKKEKDFGGYDFEVEGEDYSAYVTLKGAGGDMKDITALKKARAAITKILEDVLEKDDTGFGYRISASGKGDDLVLELLLTAPEA